MIYSMFYDIERITAEISYGKQQKQFNTSLSFQSD